MIDLAGLVEDLREEHAALDAVIGELPAARWDDPTPAIPWTIRDQISHLAFFDEQAALAASDPEGFLGSLASVTDAGAFMKEPIDRRAVAAPAVLAWWRQVSAAMRDAFRALDPAARVPWFGPPMGPASFISARLMETWAHGQDIVDTLGVDRPPTDRLKHVAHLGVRARPFSYRAHGMELPEGKVAVELTAPSGEVWSWDAGATDRVQGSALGFCLAVTQRRHIEDTDLVVSGTGAVEWMSIAQAFAGPPGAGRSPGQFSGVG